MPYVSRASLPQRVLRGGGLLGVGLVVAAVLACGGGRRLAPSPDGQRAAGPPSLTAAATLTSAAQTGAEADAPNVGLIEGTAVVLELPEVTPLPDFAATGELHWPLAMPGVLKQTYGPGHPGIDVAAPSGTPVLAADNGVVIFAEEADVYGELLIVDHGNGYQTWYGHLSGFAVVALEGVRQGGVIGYVGSTGASTGPHLHLEVRREGRAVPPFSHLPDAPQSILEANAGIERRTATAVAAATQTRAAFIAGQTATARREAELTQLAAEQTRLASSWTPTQGPVLTQPPTRTPTLTLTLTLTLAPVPTVAQTTETPPPEPSATVAATSSPTRSPTPPSPTAGPAASQTPSATPGGETPTGTPSATPEG